jgi:hypothetical protein
VAYRLYLLQTELAGSEWELAADRQLKKQRGLRFAGLLRELLPRMQALCEKRSAQEKERLTEEWLGGRLTGRQPFYFEGNVTSCRSRELIQQLFDHEITLTAADLLRGTDCTVPAGGHVNIVRRDDRFAEFEWVGLPGKTLWTTRNAVSRCPKPRPHNYILDDSPTLEVMCEVIRTELNVSGDRGAIAGRLLELPLRQATDGERRALRGDMDRNELCVMAEMREPTDTQECVIEVRGGTERAACAVDLTAFAKCLKTHPKSDRMSGCTESAVCKAAKP